MIKIRSRFFSLLEIVILFVLPIIFIHFDIIPFDQRSLVLFTISALIAAKIFKEKWTFKKLGVRFDNFKESLLPYIVFTLAAGLGLWLLAKVLGRSSLKNPLQYTHFQYMFLIVSFLQELAFRGFLIPKLKAINNNMIFVIGLNAVLFSLIHILFPDPIKLLPLSLIGGIVFAGMYYFYPNLILISISHAIINYIAVIFCFFSVNQSCV